MRQNGIDHFLLPFTEVLVPKVVLKDLLFIHSDMVSKGNFKTLSQQKFHKI